ncbi:hypothetical protein D9M69_691330 [compost metagenome]
MTGQARGDQSPDEGQDQNNDQEEAGGHGRVDRLQNAWGGVARSTLRASPFCQSFF